MSRHTWKIARAVGSTTLMLVAALALSACGSSSSVANTGTQATSVANTGTQANSGTSYNDGYYYGQPTASDEAGTWCSEWSINSGSWLGCTAGVTGGPFPGPSSYDDGHQFGAATPGATPLLPDAWCSQNGQGQVPAGDVVAEWYAGCEDDLATGSNYAGLPNYSLAAYETGYAYAQAHKISDADAWCSRNVAANIPTGDDVGQWESRTPCVRPATTL
jgi:hypothetical protein